MKKHIVFYSLGFLLLLASLTLHAEEKPTIQVNGNGSIEVMPDYIHVQVTVEKTRKNKVDAKKEVGIITQQVLDAAKKLNIHSKHIEASAIFARPEYQWNNNKRTHIGEVVNRTVNIKLYALDNYSALAEELLKLDIQQMQQQGFGYDDIEAHQNKALVIAINNAKAKAELIANTLKTHISGVYQVSAFSNEAMPMMEHKMVRSSMMMADAAPQEAPLEIKPQTVTANVNISFLIAP